MYQLMADVILHHPTKNLLKITKPLFGALYSERESNPHSVYGNRILSPACLPVPPSEPFVVSKPSKINPFFFAEKGLERKTRFELATPTLARSCSTN